MRGGEVSVYIPSPEESRRDLVEKWKQLEPGMTVDMRWLAAPSGEGGGCVLALVVGRAKPRSSRWRMVVWTRDNVELMVKAVLAGRPVRGLRTRIISRADVDYVYIVSGKRFVVPYENGDKG